MPCILFAPSYAQSLTQIIVKVSRQPQICLWNFAAELTTYLRVYINPSKEFDVIKRNPTFAHVRFPNAREDTISVGQLPMPGEIDDSNPKLGIQYVIQPKH